MSTKPGQLQYDGPDQPLGLAQGQVENGSQCQRRGDRQIGVGGLPAPGGAWLGPLSRDRRIRKPDRETAALAQGRIIRRPVRHSMLLLRNVAATGCFGFERHGRGPSVREGAVVLHRPAPDANRPIPATRWHEVHRGPAPHQRGSRPMGETEIQTVAISKNRLCALARTARAARPEPLVSLADRYPSVGWKIEAG